MKIIQKKVYGNPTMIDIPATLDNLQKKVGGYIEVVPLLRDCVLVCDEEALIKDSPFNSDFSQAHSLMFHGTVYGNYIICGISGSDFVALNDTQRDLIMKLYKENVIKTATPNKIEIII